MDRLRFFGCSFTELETSHTQIYFENHRYKLSKLVNLPQENEARCGNSNQRIINDVYLSVKNKLNSNNLFIIQFSFFHRLGLYSFMQGNEFISLTKSDSTDIINEKEKIQIQFYKDWLKYFYSKKNSFLEFEKQVDLICSYLRENEIRFICYGFDDDMDMLSEDFLKRNDFIKFENTYSFYKYATENKLRIADICFIPNQPVDFHLNETGHKKLTEFIYNKILHAMPHQTGG